MAKDKIGCDIKIGSYIVYGHALGRCAGLRIGIVRDIKEKKDYRWEEDRYSFRVRGIDMEWNYKNPHLFSKENEKISLCAKDGTLQFCTRIIVLNDKQVPDYLKQILSVVNEKDKDKKGF